METRLTTLETKWDTVIPTLATRADLISVEGRLRDEMRGGFMELQRWLIGILCTLLIAAGGGAGLVMYRQGAAPLPAARLGAQSEAEPAAVPGTIRPAVTAVPPSGEAALSLQPSNEAS